MRSHWDNAITHFDEQVVEFMRDYFSQTDRKCLLVGAAGFDPRSRKIATMLSRIMGDRLRGFFIREERQLADKRLQTSADQNEAELRRIVPKSTIEHIDVFGDDGAAVGGQRVVGVLSQHPVAEEITDIILDMSALSIGIGYPAASLLLSEAEEKDGRAFHLMISSNPELDDSIENIHSDRPIFVRGFAGNDEQYGELDTATLWIPQLATNRSQALVKIGSSIDQRYKVCPVLPFPARNPRRADNLVSEFGPELTNEWSVDPRDIVYVSERNPLDSYRTLSTLIDRFSRTVEGHYTPRVVLSPIGSKVMAAGALMVAMEHELGVKYLETENYSFMPDDAEAVVSENMLVHVLLSGPAYQDYDAATARTKA